MGEYRIRGQNKLYGQVAIGGGKNAVLPILAAAILNQGESVIHNCPRISDTLITAQILEAIGCKTRWEGNTLIVDASGINSHEVPEEHVGKMRSSIIFLGSLLSLFGHVRVSYPGGCPLGERPIDQHKKAVKEMGGEFIDEHGSIICTAERLQGSRINFDVPSVGATENAMLMAVRAEGQTVLCNAAREPEIVDLQTFLNAMGADVNGAGTSVIVINGVKKLHGAEHTVMPDRIVAGTYLAAAAITRGKIRLTNTVNEHLFPIISKLKDTGCKFFEEKNALIMEAPPILRPIDCLRTNPHPGFPTDMQPQMTALLSLANGASIISETIFESRMRHIVELKRMGADIVLSTDGKTSVVRGVKKLLGAQVTSHDLRGGAALIIAGLAAEGETIVKDAYHVERGYENIERDLSGLGADIQLV